MMSIKKILLNLYAIVITIQLITDMAAGEDGYSCDGDGHSGDDRCREPWMDPSGTFPPKPSTCDPMNPCSSFDYATYLTSGHVVPVAGVRGTCFVLVISSDTWMNDAGACEWGSRSWFSPAMAYGRPATFHSPRTYFYVMNLVKNMTAKLGKPVDSIWLGAVALSGGKDLSDYCWVSSSQDSLLTPPTFNTGSPVSTQSFPVNATGDASESNPTCLVVSVTRYMTGFYGRSCESPGTAVLCEFACTTNNATCADAQFAAGGSCPFTAGSCDSNYHPTTVSSTSTSTTTSTSLSTSSSPSSSTFLSTSTVATSTSTASTFATTTVTLNPSSTFGSTSTAVSSTTTVQTTATVSSSTPSTTATTATDSSTVTVGTSSDISTTPKSTTLSPQSTTVRPTSVPETTVTTGGTETTAKLSTGTVSSAGLTSLAATTLETLSTITSTRSTTSVRITSTSPETTSSSTVASIATSTPEISSLVSTISTLRPDSTRSASASPTSAHPTSSVISSPATTNSLSDRTTDGVLTSLASTSSESIKSTSAITTTAIASSPSTSRIPETTLSVTKQPPSTVIGPTASVPSDTPPTSTPTSLAEGTSISSAGSSTSSQITLDLTKTISTGASESSLTSPLPISSSSAAKTLISSQVQPSTVKLTTVSERTITTDSTKITASLAPTVGSSTESKTLASATSQVPSSISSAGSATTETTATAATFFSMTPVSTTSKVSPSTSSTNADTPASSRASTIYDSSTANSVSPLHPSTVPFPTSSTQAEPDTPTTRFIATASATPIMMTVSSRDPSAPSSFIPVISTPVRPLQLSTIADTSGPSFDTSEPTSSIRMTSPKPESATTLSETAAATSNFMVSSGPASSPSGIITTSESEPVSSTKTSTSDSASVTSSTAVSDTIITASPGTDTTATASPPSLMSQTFQTDSSTPLRFSSQTVPSITPTSIMMDSFATPTTGTTDHQTESSMPPASTSTYSAEPLQSIATSILALPVGASSSTLDKSTFSATGSVSLLSSTEVPTAQTVAAATSPVATVTGLITSSSSAAHESSIAAGASESQTFASVGPVASETVSFPAPNAQPASTTLFLSVLSPVTESLTASGLMASTSEAPPITSTLTLAAFPNGASSTSMPSAMPGSTAVAPTPPAPETQLPNNTTPVTLVPITENATQSIAATSFITRSPSPPTESHLHTPVMVNGSPVGNQPALDSIINPVIGLNNAVTPRTPGLVSFSSGVPSDSGASGNTAFSSVVFQNTASPAPPIISMFAPSSAQYQTAATLNQMQPTAIGTLITIVSHGPVTASSQNRGSTQTVGTVQPSTTASPISSRASISDSNLGLVGPVIHDQTSIDSAAPIINTSAKPPVSTQLEAADDSLTKANTATSINVPPELTTSVLAPKFSSSLIVALANPSTMPYPLLSVTPDMAENSLAIKPIQSSVRSVNMPAQSSPFVASTDSEIAATEATVKKLPSSAPVDISTRSPGNLLQPELVSKYDSVADTAPWRMPSELTFGPTSNPRINALPETQPSPTEKAGGEASLAATISPPPAILKPVDALPTVAPSPSSTPARLANLTEAAEGAVINTASSMASPAADSSLANVFPSPSAATGEPVSLQIPPRSPEATALPLSPKFTASFPKESSPSLPVQQTSQGSNVTVLSVSPNPANPKDAGEGDLTKQGSPTTLPASAPKIAVVTPQPVIDNEAKSQTPSFKASIVPLSPKFTAALAKNSSPPALVETTSQASDASMRTVLNPASETVPSATTVSMNAPNPARSSPGSPDSSRTGSSADAPTRPLETATTGPGYANPTTSFDRAGSQDACETAEWEPYGACSAICGEAVKVRQRKRTASIAQYRCPNETAWCDTPKCNPMDETEIIITDVMMNIGCVWILVSLGLSVLFCICLRHHYYLQLIHMNEDFSLFMAHLLLLIFAVRNDQRFSHDACKLAALGMQYFFSVTFLLQCIEALHIYTVLTDVVLGDVVFVNIKRALALAWGVPALITGVTGALAYNRLMSDFSCWINFGDIVLVGTFIPVAIVAWPTVILLEATGYGTTQRKTDEVTSCRVAQGGLYFVFGAQFASWFMSAVAIYFQRISLFAVVFGFNACLGIFIYMYHLFSNKTARLTAKKIYQRLRGK